MSSLVKKIYKLEQNKMIENRLQLRELRPMQFKKKIVLVFALIETYVSELKAWYVNTGV